MTPGLDAVVLVHGLWVHGLAMELQRWALRRHGYDAVAYSYRSVRSSLAENAEGLALYAASLRARTVHFVGHSLGGVIILNMLARGHGAGGRIVLEGVPYWGSHAARELRRWEFGQTMLGNSMREWLDAEKHVDFGRFEIGVIAGSLSLGLGRLVDGALPQPNDGVVTVEETRVPGLRDHIVLPVNHSGMLVSGAVRRQIAAFLQTGRFKRDGAGT